MTRVESTSKHDSQNLPVCVSRVRKRLNGPIPFTTYRQLQCHRHFLHTPNDTRSYRHRISPNSPSPQHSAETRPPYMLDRHRLEYVIAGPRCFPQLEWAFQKKALEKVPETFW